jgi:hypothetical protein
VETGVVPFLMIPTKDGRACCCGGMEDEFDWIGFGAANLADQVDAAATGTLAIDFVALELLVIDGKVCADVDEMRRDGC